MARWLSLLLITLCPWMLPHGVRAGELRPGTDYRSAVGMTVGLPQIIALSMETEVMPHVRAQGNLGSAGVVSSVCGRVLFVADDYPVQPYGFVGGGMLVATAHPVGAAAAPYGWYGLGIRVDSGRVILFLEGGKITLPSPFAEEAHMPVGAVGLLVEY